MKKFFFFSIFITNALISIGQDKHDNVWMIGYGKSGLGGGTRLDFSLTNPSISVFKNPAGTSEITGMCDSTGNLLFFASGCEVYDSTLSLMENGDSLNSPGENFDYACPIIFNYAYRRSVMALPTPGSSTKYAIFHLREDGTLDYEHPRSFLYTEIDMTKNGGLGMVTQKNQLILSDTFAENLTATRHANGRDWWIPVTKRSSNKIFVFRYGPEGVSNPKTSYLPFTWDLKPGFEDYWIYTFNAFSPDGNLYACKDEINGLMIAHFDRCSGEFSGAMKLMLPVSLPESYGGSVAFSPNSRFLYVSTYKKLFQFDLEAADIEGSVVLIDTYNGGPIPVSDFNQMLLAPNDKIYMSPSSSAHLLHVMENPNEKGLACQFVEGSLALPTQTNDCLPNMPYYRLHKLAGSPCDTLIVSVKNTNKVGSFFLHPNPTTDQFLIDFQSPTTALLQMSLLDLTGKTLQSSMIPVGETSFPVSSENLPEGCYFIQIKSEIGIVEVRKLVIVR